MPSSRWRRSRRSHGVHFLMFVAHMVRANNGGAMRHRLCPILFLAATCSLAPHAHATVLEPLASTLASTRSAENGSPPWEGLRGLPGVKWRSDPAKGLILLKGDLTADRSRLNAVDKGLAGFPAKLQIEVKGDVQGFNQVVISASATHSKSGNNSLVNAFHQHPFGDVSARRVFTNCDEDSVTSRTEHYVLEYEGQKPVYLAFSSGTGNASAYVTWRLHLTEAAMLSGSGPTCERER